jgi:hypothetical protein
VSTAGSTDLVQRVAVLGEDECRAVCDEVHALREHWIARDRAGLHTLGAALYLDAPRAETLERFGVSPPAPGQYDARMRTYNPVLRERFAGLYRAVEAALGRALGAEVQCAPDRALPGFHIYQDAPIYAERTAHVPHFDRQYECIDWSEHPEIDFTRAISVTLPIRLPARGGGLRVWDLSLFQVQALPPDRARTLAAAARSRRHEYRTGELVCHRGHLLHQITPWVPEPGDERITLQAHGLHYDGRWHLYW